MGTTFNDIFGAPSPQQPPPPPVNAEEFEQVLRSRRSVRRFSDRPIPEEVVRKILRAGLVAPNSSNLQPWDFYWVRSKEMRTQLNEAFLGQPAVTTCAELVVAVARTGTWRLRARQMVAHLTRNGAPSPVVKYYSQIVPLAYTVGPFGVVGWAKGLALWCLGLFRPVPRECTSRGDLRIWAVKSTALACENIMLAARAYGFDSCPMEGMDSSRVRKALRLSRDSVVVMGIALGERAPNGVFGEQFRFDENEFLHIV